jgi:ABC-2 type transport system ATP-binding protein
LTKVFNGKVKAVDHVSFEVVEGEILGFLGPNGAGKTTTLNMLSTLLKPTSGSATVNGYDIVKQPDAVRRSIGYVFQDPTLDLELTGRENLDFHGRLYHLKRDVRKKRINEMLEVVQLIDRADDFVKTYSGGMKRRLEIARGLLHHPKVLFLDEPTLGLDPQTRRSIWGHIQRLNREKNVTIILTTHYTEEADYLCGRILIIDFGKIVALDTPGNLKAQLKGDVVDLSFKDKLLVDQVRSLFKEKRWVNRIDVVSNEGVNQDVDSGVGNMASGMMAATANRRMRHQRHKATHGELSTVGGDAHEHLNSKTKRVQLLVDDGGRRIPGIVKLVAEVGVALDSVELHKPTLDDVFLSVTGRKLRDERGSFMEMVRRHRIMQQARRGGR